MPVLADDVLVELKALRKGAALNGADLRSQVGPALVDLCRITPDDPPASVRDKIVAWVWQHSIRFPPDVEQCIHAAFGLAEPFTGRLLHDRVLRLAELIDREPRTAQRRIDDALLRLVEEVRRSDHRLRPAPIASSTNDWYVDRFNAVLRLDGPSPECFEQRRIVATRDGLRALTVSTSIPKAEGSTASELDIAPLFGIRITEKRQVTASRFQFTLELPKVLAAGESAEYGVIMRIPPGVPMRPHYTFIPERRAESFEVRVCFAPDRLPERVWLVTGAFNRDIDDRAFSDHAVEPDGAGEVHASFSNLRPGLGYGVQWTPRGG